MPLLAQVTVTLLAGNARPAPAIVVLAITDADTGDPVDIANAQLRRKDPAGRVAALALTRTAVGTYVAGNALSPVLQNHAGEWSYEGRSSQVTDQVRPHVDTVFVVSDGFPVEAGASLPTASGQRDILTHRVTQAEIDAGTPVQVPCFFVPGGAVALVAGGTVVSHLVACDGVSAYVTLQMNDGASPSPFVDGDLVAITVFQ